MNFPLVYFNKLGLLIILSICVQCTSSAKKVSSIEGPPSVEFLYTINRRIADYGKVFYVHMLYVKNFDPDSTNLYDLASAYVDTVSFDRPIARVTFFDSKSHLKNVDLNNFNDIDVDVDDEKMEAAFLMTIVYDLDYYTWASDSSCCVPIDRVVMGKYKRPEKAD